MYTALDPGALVTGSPDHGTGDYVYALFGELPPTCQTRWHAAILARTGIGRRDVIYGVSFHGGALPLWVP